MKLRTNRTVLQGLTLVASFAAIGGAIAAPCIGPGAPTTGETRCLTAIAIPGNPLRSYDISWVNPERGEYYLADRSNAGIDIINTKNNTFVKTIKGFVGVKLNAAGTAVNNNISGPDGVVSHGKWLYAGDGDSTLKVIDLNAGTIVASLSTGGTTRVDEMALTTNGKILITANNAEDPPFLTLFKANGDDRSNSAAIIKKIILAHSIVPAGVGLAIEQPAWDRHTRRFYVSVPTIANNPVGCNYGQLAGPITCSGGMAVIDPTNLANPVERVVPLNACGPNGATVGPHSNILLGCTSANLPSGTTTLVINAKTLGYANIGGLVGSDEVWYDSGNDRYYTGSNRQPGGAVLGMLDGGSSLLVQTVPISSGSHSVAADAKRNRIYVPQSAPFAVVGTGGDTTTVGAGICGTNHGCIAVYTNVEVDTNNNDDDDGGERSERHRGRER